MLLLFWNTICNLASTGKKQSLILMLPKDSEFSPVFTHKILLDINISIFLVFTIVLIFTYGFWRAGYSLQKNVCKHNYQVLFYGLSNIYIYFFSVLF